MLAPLQLFFEHKKPGAMAGLNLSVKFGQVLGGPMTYLTAAPNATHAMPIAARI